MAKATTKKLTRKQFSREMVSFLDGLRRTVEAACAAFPVDPVASAKRCAKVQHDFHFFRHTYFPHYMQGKGGKSTGDSALHKWIDKALPALVDAEEGRKQAVAAPRGEAKSTIITLIFVLWCIVTGRKRFIT